MKTLRILSGGAAQGLVEQLRPAFEAETGCTIDGTFGAGGYSRASLERGAEVIGPILLGLEKPVQICPLGSSVSRILQMATFCAYDRPLVELDL